MSTPTPDIVPLTAAPQHLPLLADWYRDAWEPYYGADGPGDAEADLEAACTTHGVPHGLVALEDGEPVGTVALRTESPGSDRHPGLWVTGLVVRPDARGRGIAARLVLAAQEAARQRGASRLYTSTEIEGLVAEGWRPIDRTQTLRGPVTVYVRDL